MNLDELKTRIETIASIGVRLDDSLEAVRREAAQHEGAYATLLQASKNIEALMFQVEKAVDDGAFDLEQAKHCKTYVAKAMNVVDGMAKNHGNKRLVAQGKIQMAEQNLKMAEKAMQGEKNKVQAHANALRDAPAAGMPDNVVSMHGKRKPGEAPGPGIKARRNAEETPTPKRRVRGESRKPMPRTPDRFPGRREEESILFDARTADPPTDERDLRYDDGELKIKDSAGVFGTKSHAPRHNRGGVDEVVRDILIEDDGAAVGAGLFKTINVEHPISATVDAGDPDQVNLSIGTAVQAPVLDRDLIAPPGSPSTGDRYLVPIGPATGAWAGKDNYIAEWDGSAWVFTTPTDGMTVFVLDEQNEVTYNSGHLGYRWDLGDSNTVIFRARNVTGSTIAKGTMVVTCGFSQDVVEVCAADKDTESLRPSIGMVWEDILDQDIGLVCQQGIICGMDTSTLALTDQLVLGNSGAYVLPPPQTNPFTGAVQGIGSVARVDATHGIIQVSLGNIDVTELQAKSGQAISHDYAIWNSDTGWGVKTVAYSRLFLPQGFYDKMETGIVSGAFAGRTIDMGLYADDHDQVYPSPTGPLLASTGPSGTAGLNGLFLRVALDAPYEVPSGGDFYWLAMVSSSASLRVNATSHQSRLPIAHRVIKLESATGSSTLPATVGTLDTVTANVILYSAIVRA